MRVRRRGSPLSAQGAWATVDQALSSGTNFVPSLILARVLGPTSFGTFALVFLAWFLVLSVIRSGLMQPYTLSAAPADAAAWRHLTSTAAGAVLFSSVLAGLGFGVAALCAGIGSGAGHALLAVALLSPGLALQEFWRVAAFSAGRARSAALNDAIWAVGQTIAFVAVLTTTRITAAGSLCAWGAGAWLAAYAGIRQFNVRPALTLDAWHWLRGALRVGVWFTATNALFSVGLFLATAVIAAEVGREGVGFFRLVQSNLFGPVQLLTVAAESVFLPHLVRAIRADRRAFPVAVKYAGLMVTAVLAYGALVAATAHPLISHVFGESFSPAAALVLPMLVVYALDAASSGASVMLRAQASGGRLVCAQSVATVGRLIAVPVLIGPWGLAGGVWGLAVGSGLGAVTFWVLAAERMRFGGRRARSRQPDEELVASERVIASTGAGAT